MFSCAWRACWVAVCLLVGFALQGRLWAETAILQIRVLHGEGGVYPAGSRPAQGVGVQVTDETGAPVLGARVSFLLPEEGPSGAFSPGLRTALAVTGGDGKAIAPAPMLGAESGPLRVRVIAAKDQARAGCIVNQFVAASVRVQSPAVSALREAPQPRVSRGGGRARWLMIVGGAVAGGLAVGLTRHGSASSSPAAAAAVTVAAPRVGTPIISVGRP
ncbi:MAG: hypothetical protein U0Q16_35560 [Bryobacteraceae bacterium]